MRDFARLAIAAWLVTSTPPLMAQAPIPQKLLDAKKALLLNGGVKPPAFDRLAKELQAWNRFELVNDPSRADIVITVKPPDRTSPAGSIHLSIMTPADQVMIYGDSTGPIWSESRAVTKLVDRLRERLEPKRSKPAKGG
jgi:hypothetical protein